MIIKEYQDAFKEPSAIYMHQGAMCHDFVGDFIGDVVGGITGASSQEEAISQGAQTQLASTKEAIEEQRRQFDAIVKLMSPYVGAGQTATEQQGALIGLAGAGEQERAISALEQSPEFQALTQQEKEGILQGASATGGLRGGNIQEALAMFRPQILSGLINQQFSRLGGIAGRGQAAAAGQAAAGQSAGQFMAPLMQTAGAQLAGQQIYEGGSASRNFGRTFDLGKMIAGFF